MRPKFRAWNTKKKKMHSPEEMGKDQLCLSPDGRGFVNVSGASTRLSLYYTHLIPMQSTGLKDKAIFEGDVISIDGRETPLQVVWNAKWAGFDFLRMDGKQTSTIFGKEPHKYTVIGNIHENPALLEAQE